MNKGNENPDAEWIAQTIRQVFREKERCLYRNTAMFLLMWLLFMGGLLLGRSFPARKPVAPGPDVPPFASPVPHSESAIWPAI